MDPRPLHEPVCEGEGEGEANQSTTLPPSQEEEPPPRWNACDLGLGLGRITAFPVFPRTKQTARINRFTGRQQPPRMMPTRPDARGVEAGGVERELGADGVTKVYDPHERLSKRPRGPHGEMLDAQGRGTGTFVTGWSTGCGSAALQEDTDNTSNQMAGLDAPTESSNDNDTTSLSSHQSMASLTPQTANAATTLGALGEGESVVEGGSGGGGVVGNHDEAITTTTTTATTKPALGANPDVGVGWGSGLLPFSARKKERGTVEYYNKEPAPSLPCDGASGGGGSNYDDDERKAARQIGAAARQKKRRRVKKKDVQRAVASFVSSLSLVSSLSHLVRVASQDPKSPMPKELLEKETQKFHKVVLARLNHELGRLLEDETKWADEDMKAVWDQYHIAQAMASTLGFNLITRPRGVHTSYDATKVIKDGKFSL